MSFQDHFSTQASAYAQFRPHYPKDLFAWLASLLPRRELAWDCATGNGQAAISIADFFERVIATDASAEQIKNASPNDRVEYRVATAEDSGLASNACDLITVGQALHWFDTDAFYAEAGRTLRANGVLAVWSYTFLEIEAAIDAIVNRFYHETVGPYWPPERTLVENGYRDFSFPFPELEVPPFAMSASWTLPDLLGYLRTWSASQRFQREKGHDPVATIEDALRQVWPNPTEPCLVRWPLVFRVGRKPS